MATLPLAAGRFGAEAAWDATLGVRASSAGKSRINILYSQSFCTYVSALSAGGNQES